MTEAADHPGDTPAPSADSAVPVRELIGVYNATGTLIGEVTYWLKARLGREHCALCDITHGSLREKSEWRECRSSLATPFTTVHLDEQTPALAAVTAGATPCVVADTADGLVVLLSASELEKCAGSPARLVDALIAKARSSGLAITAPK